MKHPKLSLLAIAVASCASFSVAVAQEETPVLDEIVVTAQKRVQKLEDVPISISTIGGDKLENGGITSAAGLSDYIPSFNMTQTGIGTNIAIRGISSGVNQGFEQSTAMFVDGIHYGRAQLARSPFLDIERIEVLRGPQSILFGKNSTAGAVSIITAKPGDELEASITTLYEPEYGERDGRLVLSGPISDTVGGRMAIMSRAYDGAIENTTLDRDEAAEKDRVVRATLEWKPTDAWDLTLKLEDGSFDSTGRNIEVIKPVVDPANNPQGYDNPYRTSLLYLTGGNYLLNSADDGTRQSNGDYSFNDTDNVTLTADYDISDDLTLTSVTGYNSYTYQELCDCDFVGASGFNILSDEDYRQSSQEIRLASSEKQTVSWLAGLFYQSSDLKFHDKVMAPADSYIATALAADPQIGPARAALLRGASTQRDFAQDSTLYAAFLQATWNITDASRLLIGGRLTEESKEASRHQYHVTAADEVVTSDSTTNDYNIVWGRFKVDPHNIEGERDESKFTPQITAQHDLNSTDRVYATYTTGFKSGGYDVRSNSAPEALGGVFSGTATDGTFEFQDEKVKNYEVGGKFLLADGAVELNLAAFRSVFTNMQTSQFDGGLSFLVTNAGEATVQGVEADGRWAITDKILMRGGASFIDFEYTRFTNGQCPFGTVPDASGFCDQTGKRREFVPEFQGNIGWDYTEELSHSRTLVTTLDVIYSDSYLTTPSLDPRMEQDAFVKLNARIALSGADNAWELALIGKNLTNESIITYANGLPVASIITQGAGSAFYAFYEQPRSVALQATLRFK